MFMNSAWFLYQSGTSVMLMVGKAVNKVRITQDFDVFGCPYLVYVQNSDMVSWYRQANR